MAMSEAKWLSTLNARAMVKHVLKSSTRTVLNARSRKWSLFVVACMYGLWNRLPTPSKIAVEVYEANVDEPVSANLIGATTYMAEGVMLGIDTQLERVPRDQQGFPLLDPPECTVWSDYLSRCDDLGLRLRNKVTPYKFDSFPTFEHWPVERCCFFAFHTTAATMLCYGSDDFRYLPFAAELLRDIFANPFRPIIFDPRWRTSDVVDVARGIYEDRAFERMPILADALMDAGCENLEIIAHCRGPGPHVRGCWLVDLILGKE